MNMLFLCRLIFTCSLEYPYEVGILFSLRDLNNELKELALGNKDSKWLKKGKVQIGLLLKYMPSNTC